MNWEPFVLCPPGERAPEPRGINTPEGLGDRLRTAAFAEMQAREAFRWAVSRFDGEPESLRRTWSRLADEEDRHLGWLLRRMEELDVSPAERPVSDRLWHSLMRCKTADEFIAFMTRAEERGRTAELHFHKSFAARDPATAAIFEKIAQEEEGHIALARSGGQG